MRERGFCTSTLEEAKLHANLFDEGQLLADQIRRAFSNVVLENGVGLREARGLDDYECREVLERYRKEDETEDWSVISADDLNTYNSSLSFFDAKGMRFHLPAFLIAELNCEYNCGLVISLTHGSEFSRRKFELLSREQSGVVAEFLRLALRDPDEEFSHHAIRAELFEFWEPRIKSMEGHP